ncbi:MAG TPA: glycosyltransferase [Blastocatellia bacterium]|nr:glycosyltransferase [Blastocatellia bacterium]
MPSFAVRICGRRTTEAQLLGALSLKTDPSNLRVLQFAPRTPWPLDTGAKLRNYHLARILAMQARISLLAFGDEQNETSALERVYEGIVTVPRLAGYSFAKVLRGAVGRTPLPLLNYTTNEMSKTLAHVLAKNDFDIVQVESIHLINYLPVIRAARSHPIVVCDWHNIESDLMRQYAEREQSVARKTYARRTARLMNESEMKALNEFDGHIVVSEQDAERLRRINSRARIFVIENGVDVSYYAGEQSAGKKRIVFVGSMDYHANIDGAINFARNVWPTVRKQKPELVFTIVGRDPSPDVRALSSIEGVEVTGSVDDVRPFYCEAIAAVVPLNVGGGSRLKILEAMAAGVPVVSTKLGAEGLDSSDGENILLTDGPGQIADAVIRIIDDRELEKRLIAGGYALIRERYDWSMLGAKLLAQYQAMASETSRSMADQR